MLQEPVSLVELSASPLQLQRYVDAVANDSAGAVATFVGVTRNSFEGRAVVRLEYEAYEPMVCLSASSLREDELSRRPGSPGAPGGDFTRPRALAALRSGSGSPHRCGASRRGERGGGCFLPAPPGGAGRSLVLHR